MGFWELFFGKAAKPEPESADLSAHRPFLDSLRLPAVHLIPAKTRDFSRLGGLPSAPAEFDWPSWKDKPLAFLGQLDLAALPDDADTSALPHSGCLLFFYNTEQDTWGFDPKDRGSWRVCYFKNTAEAKIQAAPTGLKEDSIFPEIPLQFQKILTYPDWQDERVRALPLNDAQGDAYAELSSSPFEGKPLHQMLGYASPIQGDHMDLECQLVSNGVYCGDSKGYEGTEAARLEKGRTDWLLLLQLDTDDDAGMMWGDVGRLYFWIKKEDLAKRDFSNVWMILQCS